MSADSTIIVKSSSGWKFKVVLGLGGLVVLTILAFLFRVEAGIIALVAGLGAGVRVWTWALYQVKLSKYEARRIEAEVSRLEYEAVKAKAESYFVQTNSGVFQLAGIVVDAFYPAVSASKALADVPLLTAPETQVTRYRKLLDVDYIHLLVVGPSGSGKTTVLCHLIDNAPNNTLVYVLDPHAKFNEWPNRVNEIVGKGRDYLAINSKLIDLISVMDKRYNGVESTSQKVLIIADEWLSILDKCQDAKDFFNGVGSEARKVNMHLVISSISSTVDDLAVSGAIRDNLAQLTLSRTLKSQNLGELKWSRKDTELVELPGRYIPALPPRIESLPVKEEEELPVSYDAGPLAYTPTINELKVYELFNAGESLRSIYQQVYGGSFGGNQAGELKAILAKFGVSV